MLWVLHIDRKNKILKVKSSLTNDKWKQPDWKFLFDKGKERIQEKLTDKMNDELFKKLIVFNMAKAGYSLVKEETK